MRRDIPWAPSGPCTVPFVGRVSTRTLALRPAMEAQLDCTVNLVPADNLSVKKDPRSDWFIAECQTTTPPLWRTANDRSYGSRVIQKDDLIGAQRVIPHFILYVGGADGFDQGLPLTSSQGIQVSAQGINRLKVGCMLPID